MVRSREKYEYSYRTTRYYSEIYTFFNRKIFRSSSSDESSSICIRANIRYITGSSHRIRILSRKFPFKIRKPAVAADGEFAR